MNSLNCLKMIYGFSHQLKTDQQANKVIHIHKRI